MVAGIPCTSCTLRDKELWRRWCRSPFIANYRPGSGRASRSPNSAPKLAPCHQPPTTARTSGATTALLAVSLVALAGHRLAQTPNPAFVRVAEQHHPRHAQLARPAGRTSPSRRAVPLRTVAATEMLPASILLGAPTLEQASPVVSSLVRGSSILAPPFPDPFQGKSGRAADPWSLSHPSSVRILIDHFPRHVQRLFVRGCIVGVLYL